MKLPRVRQKMADCRAEGRELNRGRAALLHLTGCLLRKLLLERWMLKSQKLKLMVSESACYTRVEFERETYDVRTDYATLCL